MNHVGVKGAAVKNPIKKLWTLWVTVMFPLAES
jgi:hypothetical protein